MNFVKEELIERVIDPVSEGEGLFEAVRGDVIEELFDGVSDGFTVVDKISEGLIVGEETTDGRDDRGTRREDQ